MSHVTVTAQNSQFTNNLGSDGGAFCVQLNGGDVFMASVSLSDLYVSGNVADGHGGGLFLRIEAQRSVVRTTIAIAKSTIDDNVVSTYRGFSDGYFLGTLLSACGRLRLDPKSSRLTAIIIIILLL